MVITALLNIIKYLKKKKDVFVKEKRHWLFRLMLAVFMFSVVDINDSK